MEDVMKTRETINYAHYIQEARIDQMVREEASFSTGEIAKDVSEEEIRQIYDRIFKRIFSLSNRAIINLINGLYQKNYPADCVITYLNKEFVSKTMSWRFADVLVQIGYKDKKETYHLEAQMYKDKSIVVRVFEYGFLHAMEDWEEGKNLVFPEPVIIYLDKVKNIPAESILNIQFGN